MKSFWETLPKPFFALAPMEDVTDTVFRQIVASCARPDVFFTEFTNTDGMCSDEGARHVMKRLQFTKVEHPLVAQIWGTNPTHFKQAAETIAGMGFDGIDINMGCPIRDVIKNGACAALIKTPSLAKEIILATKEGAGELPISVKTRIGFSSTATEEWCGFLLEQNLAALTIHGRTAKEMSKVPSHWDEIGKVVQLRDSLHLKTKIIGNGDVMSLTEAREKVEKYNVDGVMIGRGIFSNVWLFNESIDPARLSLETRLKKLLEHVDLHDATWGTTKNFPLMRKFVKAYINGFDQAAEMRGALMKTGNAEEMREAIDKLFSSHLGGRNESTPRV